jgi:drug/metabolite transporter (DMT)-like permease
MFPRWVFWTLLTMFSWGIWAVLGEAIGKDLSDPHKQLFSTVGMAPVMAALYFMRDTPPPGSRRRGILLAFGAGLVSGVGNIYFYEVLGSDEAVTVIPLTALYPLVTVLLAVVLLHERINRIQLIGISLSLAAIYLFFARDEKGFLTSWLFLALAPIGLWGLAGLLQKMTTNEISARSAALWFLAAFIPLAGWIIWREPPPTQIETRTWLLAAALGFTLALGNLTVILAFASGKASIVAPLAGLYSLVSVPIAIVAFGEQVKSRQSLAIALSLAAVILLSWESRASAADHQHLETDTSV